MNINNDIKKNVKIKLAKLVDKYNSTIRKSPKNSVSEETIRTWINEMLQIFGWDVQDIKQVIQEKILSGQERERLLSISSTHIKPDYVLKNGSNIKTFIDTKSLMVDIFNDVESAYQIRCYGWSAQVPCAFLTNFEKFAIFDTRFLPKQNDPATNGVIQISIDDYIEKFDLIFEHLWHDNICSNKLEKIYEVSLIDGNTTVDSKFSILLSKFRVKLAQALIDNNREMSLNPIELNYYTQVILDRIVFIRVCETKGIEEQEKLRKLNNGPRGFWEEFKSSCYMEFYNHYDGAMFSRDDKFQKLKLKDRTFKEFIDSLYYPYPYKFDVIPVKVLAKIYEEFLGKQLQIVENKVIERIKDEHIKTNGAVATPEYIVDIICKQTISLDYINSIEHLLKIKILDPCCGSGVFAVACYELLSDKMINILKTNKYERNKYKDFFFEYNSQIILTIKARRELALNCIYGIDCDESAVEVTKMSLALKIVDGNDSAAWSGIGAFGTKILKEIAKNIRLGNTLVSTDWDFNANEVLEIKPFDIKRAFPEVFDISTGFDFIVTNPPYVETKLYKAATPVMHSYLYNKYNSFEGKADLSVLFIEKCISLLKDRGKFGSIVQRRWFRTEYGASIRKIINSNHYLYSLIDFKTTNIFKGRIVYSSIMILLKDQIDSFKYYYMEDDPNEIKRKFENSSYSGNFESYDYKKLTLPAESAIWMFNNSRIVSIRDKLIKSCGKLGDFPGLQIKDGVQALWKKMYHLTDVSFVGNKAVGRNGFNEKVIIEKELLRGIIYNRVFYPFKHVTPNAYVIFPYIGNTTNPITYDVIKKEYPLAYKYLSKNKKRILENVECRKGNMWITFTREHNHSYYDSKKIVIPMTAKDTFATYSCSEGLYMDNSNVWFITVVDASDNLMKAISCIINSTVFSVLGKVAANPQSGGYYKFNKQFLMPIPFPSKSLSNEETVNYLADLYNKIDELQQKYISAIPSQKIILSQTLELQWNCLDDYCANLYQLSESEKNDINDLGRSESRIELLSD